MPNDAMVVVGVLGPMVVDDDVAIAPRERVVLGALVLRRGEVVSPEALADALWVGGSPPASWVKVVQGCVVRLRKVLGASAIETHPRGYRLALPPEEVDAGRFERLVGRARQLLALGEPDRASFALEEALGLWRGRAFSELEDWEAAHIEAERLEALRLDAEELQLEAALRAGRHRDVLPDAQARVAQAPLREHRWTLLALAQNQCGRQAEALRTLHQARMVLARETGLEPGADLVALESAILRQDPELLSAGVPEASAVCPYRGLAAYDVDDADAFHGRDLEIAECLDRLRRDGVLAVAGPSGSGKSSLVRAGVAAALRRDGRRVVVITPGAHPMHALGALTEASAAAVLVVDQCEEAFTLCTNGDERARFLDLLAAHVVDGPLVIGLRADRLGELAAHPRFAGVVEGGLYILKAMDADRLRVAIGDPARQAGLLLEPGLVDLLVHELDGEPGSLPLLSHALAQTWERREGQTMTVAGYHASGGIRGAVAQSAERVYDRVPSVQRSMLRDLMLRLVTLDPGGDTVRSRVPRRVAAPDEDHARLIETLTEARLVISDTESVELAHESLARAWPRLRNWLEDDVEGQRIWRHLAATAETWEEMGRPESELYRGVRLARVTEWRKDAQHTLTWTEQEFLVAAEELADNERALTEEQARRTARTNRRLWVLAACVTLLAVAATTGGFVATRQAQRADREAVVARNHELAASALGALDQNPALAKLLAVSAAQTGGGSSLAVDAALHQAWAADLTVARWGFAGEVGVLVADINPTGDRLAAAGIFQADGSGSTVQVVDPFTDELDWAVDVGASGAASAFVAEPSFADDGAHVVAGVFWDPYSWRRVPIPFDGVDEPRPDLLGAHVWDATTGQLIDRVDLGRCGGVVAAVSPTHLLARTLHGPPDVLEACRWRDGSVGVELIDRRTGIRNVLTAATGNELWSQGAAMSADGRRVAFDAPATGETVVIDVATGAEVTRLPAAGVRALDPDGSLVLVGGRPLEVYGATSGRLVTAFDGHGGSSLGARFSPSGETVYSVGDDGALHEWDASTGRELFTYPDIGSGPLSVNENGLIAVSTPDQQYVTLVDPNRRGEVGSAHTCAGHAGVDTLRVVDGTAVLHQRCNESSTMATLVVDLASGRRLARIPGRELGGLDVSPDGRRMVDQEVTATGPGALTVRDLQARSATTPLDPLPGRTGWPVAHRVRWSPDGRFVAAAMEGSLAVWEAGTGALVGTGDAPNGESHVSDVVFTPDSTGLISATGDRQLSSRRLAAWNEVSSAEVLFEGAYATGLVGFTADGSDLLAIGGFQANAVGTLVSLDPETFELRRSRPNIHEGVVTSAAMSGDRSLLATAASDGSVRVWDTATGALVHDVPGDGTAVHGVAFDGKQHLVLARDGGGLDVITIDSSELLDLVRGSLTRGFTASDCQRFNFGDDCPTLAEVGATPPGAGALSGTFGVALTRERFVDASSEVSVERYGAAPPPGALVELAASFAGRYTLELDDGRFDLTRAGATEAVCVGSFRIRGDHLWLRSERGDCYPVKLLDSRFELTAGELRLDAERARADFPWWIVLTSQPLHRVR